MFCVFELETEQNQNNLSPKQVKTLGNCKIDSQYYPENLSYSTEYVIPESNKKAQRNKNTLLYSLELCVVPKVEATTQEGHNTNHQRAEEILEF